MADSPQLIDWHTHCALPEHSSVEARADSAAHGVRRAASGSPESHKAAMDEAGADKFVVVATPRRPGHHQPHEFISEYVSRYPGRAVGFGSVHPDDAGALKEFQRSVKDLGLKGLKLSPVYQNFDPWSDNAWQIYEAAQDMAVPVMFHQGGVYDPHGALEWGNPVMLDKVARSFPDLKIIIAHLGQPWMEETVIVMRKNLNVFTDLSARFHRKWQLYNGLMVAIEYGVTDRILFGSDFPVMTTQGAVTAFKNINDWGEGVNLPPIPEELIDDIIYNRPFELLGL